MISMVDLCYKDSNITATMLGGGSGRVCEGRAWEGRFLLLVLGCFCCNSYVNRSIKLCMYVDDTKFDLTP